MAICDTLCRAQLVGQIERAIVTPAEQIAYIEQQFPGLEKRQKATQTGFWMPELGPRGRAVRIRHHDGQLKLAATALRFRNREHVIPKFAGPAETLRQHVESELAVLEEELNASGASGSLRNWQIAVQALQALGGEAMRAAILDWIRVDHPAFDAEDLRKDLAMLSVNDDTRFNYRAWETKRSGQRANRDLVFRGAGAGEQTVYELYDPAVHGVWVAYLDNPKGPASPKGKMLLRRQEASIPDLVPALAESLPPFDPATPSEGKLYVARAIAARQGQRTFRVDLLGAYGNKCCLSDCSILDIVEAAHIYPYDGKNTNNLTNGLPLRADLHTLFDRGLLRIRVGEKLTWEVHPSLMGDSDYKKYDGKVLEPLSVTPSLKSLEQHRKDHEHRW